MRDFEEFLARERRNLMALALSLSFGDRERAEDLYQDTCLRAWEMKDRLLENTDPIHYTRQIMRNRHVDLLRKKRPTVPFSKAVDPPAAISIEREAEKNETLEEIRLALGYLANISPMYAEVVWYVDCLEWSYERYSTEFSVTLGTVRSRLNRARALLRRILDGTHPSNQLAPRDLAYREPGQLLRRAQSLS